MLLVTTDKPIRIKRKPYEAKDGSLYVNYSTVIRSKNYEGKTVNCEISVKFFKDIDIPDKTVINVLDGMIAFNAYSKMGYKFPYVFIKSYEIVELGKEPEEDGSAFEDYDDYSYV